MQYSNNSLGASRSPSTSNDRLQKAIERNRAKIQKRAGIQDGPNLNGSPPRGVPLSKMQSMSARREIGSPTRSRLPRKVSPSTNATISSSRKEWNSTEAQRTVEDRLSRLRQKRKSRLAVKSVATGEKLNYKEFLKNFLLGSEEKPKVFRWVIKFCWLGLFIFSLHVLLGDRGTIEYYAHLNDVNSLRSEVKSNQKENGQIIFELNQIQNNQSYQRKIIRDYLGYISHDEYLVIFPESTIL